MRVQIIVLANVSHHFLGAQTKACLKMPLAHARLAELNKHQTIKSYRCLLIHDLQVRGSKSLGCLACHEEVSRFCTRGESDKSLHADNKACKPGSILVLKPRADSSKVQNKGIKGPTKRTYRPNFFCGSAYTLYWQTT